MTSEKKNINKKNFDEAEEQEAGNLTEEEDDFEDISQNFIPAPASLLLPLQQSLKKEIKEHQSSRLPSNIANSCFIDSPLVALFATQNRILDFYFLFSLLKPEHIPTKQVVYSSSSQLSLVEEDLQFRRSVRRKLIQVTKRMRGLIVPNSYADRTIPSASKLISDLRQELATKARFHLGGEQQVSHVLSCQQDSLEWLLQLLEILQLHESVNRQVITVYVTNDMLTSQVNSLVLTSHRNEHASCLWMCHQWPANASVSSLLQIQDDSILHSPYRSASGTLYFRKITIMQFVPQMFFIIGLQRVLATSGQLNDIPVNIEETVNLNNHCFFLHAMVLRLGKETLKGHFVSVIQEPLHSSSSLSWKVYDNLRPTQERIFTNFEDILLDSSLQAKSTCVMLIYTT